MDASLFCPLETAWGDVATWVSGIAAAAAVGVALWTSRDARRIAQEGRDAADRAAAVERERARTAREDQATCLALVFHHELWLLGGQLEHFSGLLEEAAQRATREELIELLAWTRPKEALTLLSRLAESLDVFERDTRAKLLLALSGWISISQAPAPSDLADAPVDIIQDGAARTAETFAQVVRAIEDALIAITPAVQMVRPGAEAHW